MKSSKFLILSLFIFSLTSALADTQSTEQEPKNRSLKEKYQIAKIVLSNGTSGITDVVKEKFQQSALLAKDAIASSVEQTQIAIERAKAEYAQTQTDTAKQEVENLKKEIEALKKELEVAKRMLVQAQEAARKR